MKRVIGTVLAWAIVVVAVGLTGPALVVAAVTATATMQDTKSPVSPKPPEYTEVQRLKIENLALREQTIRQQVALLQQAMQQIQTEREAFVAAVEKEHPGWRVNRETMALEKIETPSAPPKK